ncbi:MAG: hypothetical protein ACOH2A_11870 [Sphingobacteriaceae bacterium]
MHNHSIDRIINQFKDYDLGTVVIELNREAERLIRVKPEVAMADRPEYTVYQQEINCLIHLLHTGKVSHDLQHTSLKNIRPVIDLLIERGHLPAEFSTVFG